MGRKRIVWIAGALAATLFLILAFAIFSATKSNDEVHTLFENWLRGREVALVRLHVRIPGTSSADYCVVSVYRFPTPLNPTRNGGIEHVETVKVKPGSTAIIRVLVKNAPPVAYTRDNDGSLVVAYREPQEYLVSVKCVRLEDKVAKLVFSQARMVEVRSAKPIADVKVEVGSLTATANNKVPSVEPSGSPHMLNPVCRFDRHDSCTAETALAVLNSIPGLETYLKTIIMPVRSAVYLSVYEQDCLEWDLATCKCRKWGGWKEAGKKLVATISAGTVGPARDGETGLATAYVKYRIYYWPGDRGKFAEACYNGPSWVIYPTVMSPGRIVKIGYYNQSLSPPHYAVGPLSGDLEIAFHPTDNTSCSSSDSKTGVSTSIRFCYALGCTRLSINVYKAGRSDSQYTTPVLVVKDERGGSPWYYWWYKNDDPMSYEVEFYGGS